MGDSYEQEKKQSLNKSEKIFTVKLNLKLAQKSIKQRKTLKDVE